jgi:glycosyltransferase involved in cell wall biosynthesis|tara:strand:- start:1302 stop:2246 length:945 start_codon:yes stop_codon:yes gene_type:complete
MNSEYTISVIIPYYNEEKTIKKTLELIKSQSYQPKKILLINSSSTDNTSNLIDKWIIKNKCKNKYKNIFKNTKYPSTSKNLGIKLSKTEWLAFMDCDLKFKKDWLQKQVKFLQKNNLKIVLGTCYLKGNGLVDACCVAQTWGYKTKKEVIPSSVINKKILKKFGLFYPSRAGYDRLWINNLKKIYKIKVRNDYTVEYNNFNHSNNLIIFFGKILKYSLSSNNIKNLNSKNYYIILILLNIFLLFLSPKLFIIFFIFYLISRSYIFPIYKSKSLKIFKDYLFSILILPIVGTGIDLTRVFSLILISLRKIFSIPQ